MTSTERPRPTDGRRRPIRLAAAALTTLTLAVGAIGMGVAQAAPPTQDPTTSAEYGARWLATQVNAEGFIANAAPSTDPNFGSTLQGALSLATAEVEEPTFDRMMAYLTAHADEALDVDGSDDPGRIGILLMLAEATGTDPSSFGGVDLPARLQATLGTYDPPVGDPVPGLYGANDPTYDGVFRQSFAILGQSTVGAVPTVAVDWLIDQQCDDAVPEAEGGWEAFRLDPSADCSVPNPDFFSGADTNSSAMAISALAALGPFAGEDAALDFLNRAMNADGGFGYIIGGPSDVNSSALSTQAIRAGGDDPTTGRWAQGAVTPVSYLLSWQVGCGAPAADQGAFAFGDTPAVTPNVFATVQAIWGVSGVVFPLAGPTTFHAAAVPCLPPTTTTSTTTVAPSSTTTSTTTPATSPVAQAVRTQPAFAG